MQTVWIEIPVQDFDRALAFYQAVFDLETSQTQDDGVRRTATLTNMTEAGRPGISLNQTTNFAPSDRGVLVYIDTGADLSTHLGRVAEAGGRVVEAKTAMGEAGFYATFLDTEGNLLALYSYR
jgi:uncharacterized protein